MKNFPVFAAVLSGCAFFSSCTPAVTADYAVVPLPSEIVYDNAEGLVLRGSAAANPFEVAEVRMVGDIPAEGYRITVSADGIVIEAGDEAGAFYAAQTLKKSVPVVGVGAEAKLPRRVLMPAARITDAPGMEWRGMHLDVARHFFDVATVEKYIDLLAMHNLNRFHFHLTDDQGWRVEIKKHPGLTEIGSKGKDSRGLSSDGFFTQDELRHIVKYAAERHITIVPEIDMPGHMLAALAVYPELGCTGGPYEITGQPGVMADILCAGNDGTMDFLKDVFAEIVEIFPSEFIHIGGDEAPRDKWRECPKCQAKMKALGLKSEAGLQSLMTAEIAEFLASKGRRIIGWDEILEGGGVPDDAAVMAWRTWARRSIPEAIDGGHDVVMTPNDPLYFDYYQAPEGFDQPAGIGGLNTLEKVYALDVMAAEAPEKGGGSQPEAVPDAQKRGRILGVQANLWTEYVATPEHLFYMALPRMAALAEVAWSDPDKRDYSEFLPRLERMCRRYELSGYNYCPYPLAETKNN